MPNIAQRVALKMLEDQHLAITLKIMEIKADCKHTIVQTKSYGGAYCKDCNTNYGWWCPDSPDHLCHYHTHEVEGYLLTARAVELVDDTEYIIHDYQGDPKYENADDCVFCHEPDERK